MGHLISKYLKSTPIVYNYAVGGHRIDGVARQVADQFLADGPGDPYSSVRWNAAKSLFGKSNVRYPSPPFPMILSLVTSIGFNDVARPSVGEPRDQTYPLSTLNMSPL